jgi:hypothetical protein
MDKAEQFLAEMMPKLCNPDLLSSMPESKLWNTVWDPAQQCPAAQKGELYSETTKKFYPLRVSLVGGVMEVSLTVDCQDLGCTQNRFVGMKDVHIGFVKDEILLVSQLSELTNKPKTHGPLMQQYRGGIRRALERNFHLQQEPKRTKAQRLRGMAKPKRSFGQLELRLGK